MTPFGAAVRAIAAYNTLRYLYLRVEGLEHLPAHGPALIAARHYHHLFDGAALVHGLPRQPHIFVALDWTRSLGQRLIMETVCNLADWPVALRARLGDGVPSAFAHSERERYVRRAIAKGADLLRRGHVLVIFPEGYPTIDPSGSRKSRDDEFLPFARGLTAVVAQAQRRGSGRVPIVPAGLRYRPRGEERYEVRLRLGEPLALPEGADRTALLHELEQRVRELSA